MANGRQQDYEVSGVNSEVSTDVLIDSGAQLHCCPPSFAEGSFQWQKDIGPVSSVTGAPIQHFGTREVYMGTVNENRLLQCNMEVTNVRMPVMAVSEINDRGFDVLFNKNGSKIK